MKQLFYPYFITLWKVIIITFILIIPVLSTPAISYAQAACGDASSPSGSVISTGSSITASAHSTGSFGAQYLVDGVIDNNYWNSQGYPPGWVEINLGSPQTVTGVKLWVTPGATSTHQVYAGSSPNPSTSPANLRRTLNCTFVNEQSYNVVFPTPLTNVQYIRVNTPNSNQWLAWREIRVYGSAPGAQTTFPGIIFSGDGSATFGQGRASTQDWIVGGLVYPEVVSTITNPSTTAYDYMYDKITNANIPVKELNTFATCLNLANCTLPNTITNGVYHATGDVTLNAITFPSDKNFIFLIDGDLRIQGSMITPNGSTVFVSTSRDIIVDRAVGTATNLFPLPSGQVQGIFSADRDFVIDGINNCVTGKDKMLNVEGAIVTNALGNGGQFRTQRDLCGDNPNIPSFTIRLRLDFVLNAPIVLMRQRTTYREAAP